MELQLYWQIIWKRIWIPALLLVIVGGVSWVTQTAPPTVYTTSMRFALGVKPQQVQDQYGFDSYYAYQASEYFVDDMTVIVSSQAFAADVNETLEAMGRSVRVPPGSISGIAVAGTQHRILSLSVSWGNAEELTEISQAIVQTMTDESEKYAIQLLGTPGGLVEMIDEPSPPAANAPSLTDRLQLPIRLLLALAAGLGLTFLLDYLDTSVRNRTELEAMGISVLAEVPKQ
ncbi:MAG: hypothetical protein AAF485_14900 [Chloroflexota bacterium]